MSVSTACAGVLVNALCFARSTTVRLLEQTAVPCPPCERCPHSWSAGVWGGQDTCRLLVLLSRSICFLGAHVQPCGSTSVVVHGRHLCGLASNFICNACRFKCILLTASCSVAAQNALGMPPL
eukprot:scaffold19007_cov19-Tisochrysis_lutea.AAC.6